jgi:hypothetical protein
MNIHNEVIETNSYARCTDGHTVGSASADLTVSTRLSIASVVDIATHAAWLATRACAATTST